MTTLATWFHCSAKPISRGKGRSAVAAAAYRLGICLHDERSDLTHDYTRRGGVVSGFTLAPASAPDWARDPAQLWNAAEAKENRKNSQTALEWEVALPNELNDPAREAIARRFSQWLVDTYGVAVSTGIHRDGQRPNGPNDHMHVEMTTRAFDDGTWAKNKLRDFNCRPGQSNPEIDHVREQMAGFINDALEDAGSQLRVSHLSYEALGIDKEPTTHLGPTAAEMERRDPGSSDRGDRNRTIESSNLELDRLVGELAALDAEIAELEEQRLDDIYGPAEADHSPTPVAELPTSSPAEAAIQQSVNALEVEWNAEAAASPILEAVTLIEHASRSAEQMMEAAARTFETAFDVPAAPDARSTEEPTARSVETALAPAIAAVETTGETSPGARRRWKKMIDAYWSGMDHFAHRLTDRITDLGRAARGSWQRFVGRRADRDYQGPER